MSPEVDRVDTAKQSSPGSVSGSRDGVDSMQDVGYGTRPSMFDHSPVSRSTVKRTSTEPDRGLRSISPPPGPDSPASIETSALPVPPMIVSP